jgi:hypothetical protein
MTDTSTKKITLATFKKFIRENFESLHISHSSTFDGMTDGQRSCDKVFRKIEKSDRLGMVDHDLGVSGVYLVGSSRDYFTAFEQDGYHGITVLNCCGCFRVGLEISRPIEKPNNIIYHNFTMI